VKMSSETLFWALITKAEPEPGRYGYPIEKTGGERRLRRKITEGETVSHKGQTTIGFLDRRLFGARRSSSRRVE